MDKLGGDDGGHLIGYQFFGPHESINLVPMRRSLNRPVVDLDDPTAPKGSWWYMEKEWQNALNATPKKSVNVKIEVIYGESKRPTNFIVKYSIDGVQQTPKTFKN